MSRANKYFCFPYLVVAIEFDEVLHGENILPKSVLLHLSYMEVTRFRPFLELWFCGYTRAIRRKPQEEVCRATMSLHGSLNLNSAGVTLILINQVEV